MTAPRRAAVLMLGRARPNPVEVAEAVQALRAAGAAVTVVTHDHVELVAGCGDGAGPTVDDLADVRVVVVGRAPQPGRGTGSRAARLVRLVVRMLLRRTPAANLTRAALNRHDVRDSLRAADVVVAGDPNAIEAAWRAAKRLTQAAVVNGVPAAVRALRGS